MIDLLGHDNQWWRMTAQRLLVEWSDPESVELLENLYEEGENPMARLHALRTLEGMNALDLKWLVKGFKDSHPEVRRHSLLMVESHSGREEVFSDILPLANDPDPRVRMQWALTLSTFDQKSLDEVQREKILQAQLELAKKDMEDPWIRIALVASIQDHPLPILQALHSRSFFTQHPESQQLISPLAQIMGESQSADDLLAVLKVFPPTETPAIFGKLTEGLAKGLGGNSEAKLTTSQKGQIDNLLSKWERPSNIGLIHSLWTLRQSLGMPLSNQSKNILAKAHKISSNPEADESERMAHLRLMEFVPFEEKEGLLFELIKTDEPKPIQLEAARQIGKENRLEISRKVLDRWSELGPEVRKMASDMLLYRSGNHDLLLTALENGDIQLGEMNFHLERRRTLLFADDPDTRKRAEALFSDAGVVKRKEAIENMRPALSMNGNPKIGYQIFSAACASCHTKGKEGKEIGPDLSEIYRKSAETLLHEILDPNAAVDSRYVNHTVKTHEGEIIAGIVAHETDSEITLRQMNGEDRTVSRKEVASFQSSGLSLMPEGLESGLTPQEMADLLAFLQEVK